MKRPSPAEEAAQTAARMVYPETNLSEHGDMLYLAWQQDWAAVLGRFRRTENALKGLNALRQEEGDEPLKTEEELSEFFSESEEWELAFTGNLSGIKVRVWSYAPWEGQFAVVVARDKERESVATAATSLE